MFPNQGYFEDLRGKINSCLSELVCRGKIDDEIARRQIEEFPWLYGALEKIPSDEMFIAENPSIAGIESANIDTIDGNPPDIETQWRGGEKDSATVVSRKVLFDLGLKTTPPNKRNGWNCYITNVIKQVNYAKFQKKKTAKIRNSQGEYWVDILRWEIDHVQPRVLYCLGGNAFKTVKHLNKIGGIQRISFFQIWHYSAYRSPNEVRSKMEEQIIDVREKVFRNNF